MTSNLIWNREDRYDRKALRRCFLRTGAARGARESASGSATWLLNLKTFSRAPRAQRLAGGPPVWRKRRRRSLNASHLCPWRSSRSSWFTIHQNPNHAGLWVVESFGKPRFAI